MLRIALAQIATVVGDLEANAEKIRLAISEAKRLGADIVALPELAITGYPPEDLLAREDFVQAGVETLMGLVPDIEGICAIVGCVHPEQGELFNAAAIVSDGKILDVYRKHHLPNYGVFDERRYFQSGAGISLIEVGDQTVGVTVCEDLWEVDGPHASCAAAGATGVININASPFHMGKGKERIALLKERATRLGVWFAYVNIVGGQDELVFDGQSCAVDERGDVVAMARRFESEMLVFDVPRPKSPVRAGNHPASNEAVRWSKVHPSSAGREPLPVRMAPDLAEEEEAYTALVTGVRDYVTKNGFSKVLVGISGGIDSALTAAIAVDGLGPDAVLGVSNPSSFTSGRTMDDSRALAQNLEIELAVLPIEEAYDVVLKTLDPVFAGKQADVAEENIQARLRGLLWMAISNKTGRLVLSTGNKSEMAVGYATLYGDMAGGFAVLKDVPKTLVYRLARWRNLESEIIPASIIERPPTAELRHDQLDTDSLPAYEVLDPILEAYVEDDLAVPQIVSMGFQEETVVRVVAMVDRAEYKRRQAPPGIKITDRAFGKDRRFPITNRYQPYR